MTSGIGTASSASRSGRLVAVVPDLELPFTCDTLIGNRPHGQRAAAGLVRRCVALRPVRSRMGHPIYAIAVQGRAKRNPQISRSADRRRDPAASALYQPPWHRILIRVQRFSAKRALHPRRIPIDWFHRLYAVPWKTSARTRAEARIVGSLKCRSAFILKRLSAQSATTCRQESLTHCECQIPLLACFPRSNHRRHTGSTARRREHPR